MEKTDTENLRALMSVRFDWFVAGAFRTLEPNRELVSEDYIEAMCFALQEAATTDGSRLLVTMPPRVLKSFSAAVCLPAWLLGNDPTQTITVVTYAQRLEREHSDNLRKLMSSDFYRCVFPHVILDSSRTDRLRTAQGGGFRPVTVSGSFTGLGTDVLILDDLQKAQDIGSDVMRQEVMSFYCGTAITRFNSPERSRIIAIMHRLHPDDLPNMLIESGVFEHLNLPAVAPNDGVFPLYDGETWEVKAGDFLSPARLNEAELKRMRKEMGAADFSAQYLQDPETLNLVVDVGRLHWVDDVLSADRILVTVQSIDTAVKIGDHCDYSVISTFGFDGLVWHLVDVVRARLDYSDLKAATRAAIARWRPMRVLIEDAQTGSAVVSELRDELRSANIELRQCTPEGDKAERLAIATDKLYAGEIVFPKNAPWSETVRRELAGFPGRHDDIVDTISQFVIRWLQSPRYPHWERPRPGEPYEHQLRRRRTRR